MRLDTDVSDSLGSEKFIYFFLQMCWIRMRSRLSKGHCTYFTPNWESYVNEDDNNVQGDTVAGEFEARCCLKVLLCYSVVKEQLQSENIIYI